MSGAWRSDNQILNDIDKKLEKLIDIGERIADALVKEEGGELMESPKRLSFIKHVYLAEDRISINTDTP